MRMKIERSYSTLAVAALLLFAAVPYASAQTPEEKLAEMGIELPTPSPPVANYVRAVRTGDLVFLAGHGTCYALPDDLRGQVSEDLTVEEGYRVARDVGVCLLASLKQEIGELSKVRRIVKVLGMVNSPPGFGDQPKVINGFSDLMVELFGDRGKHARAAVGMAALPSNIPVEIEMIVEVEE